ncbi:MAG TPA: hypothetical protein VKP67_06030 [Xanthobacteraceae bacterium]|nr:hypothetical protein [Xanthobacteraceae bacterium]
MHIQREFLVLLAAATLAAMPAAAQTTSAAKPAESTADGGTVVPDLSRVWAHPALPWFEPPASGPGPITNLSRWPEQRPAGLAGSAALPASKVGISNYDQLVGDYKNPILKPWAAAVVKKFGEISLAGITYPNASNQCWPRPGPFVLKNSQMQMIQQPDKITMIYNENHEVRRVRLNEPHRAPVTPSWYGDSVGHYEGDTLVIDTVGVKTDRKYAMIDLFGTPYTDKLHVVERYRLRDYDDVKDAVDRNVKENWLMQGDIFSQHRGRFLQLHLTIEDDGVFTTPWTATLTYVPGPVQMAEQVCAENRAQYYTNDEADVPKADKQDF